MLATPAAAAFVDARDDTEPVRHVHLRGHMGERGGAGLQRWCDRSRRVRAGRRRASYRARVPGPHPDNPEESTARELLANARDRKRLSDRRIELILQALDEGGSTRRVGWLDGTSEATIRRVLERHGTAELKKKISARDNKKRERQDFWPFKSKAEHDAFMKYRGEK